MDVHRGSLDANGLRIVVVAARFNALVVDRLVDGAVAALQQIGARDEDLSVVWVPGSFEIPLAARQLAERGDIDGVVCVGAVIRGDTAHFDYVSSATTQGIAEVARTSGVPVGFGVLTVDTMEQALDRAGGKQGNKGADTALAVVETINVLRELRRPRTVARPRRSRSS